MVDQNLTEDVQVSPPNISEKGIGGLSINLLSLPNELLFRIISFLSMACIRKLFINQRLRPICEQCLYEEISLSGQTRRSLRLLETFACRPDLALQVRRLEIDVSWFNKWEGWNEEMPQILSPDGMDALALARNIVSLRVSGDCSWTKLEARTAEAARLRETISKMKLIDLEIEVPSKEDPDRFCCTLGARNELGSRLLAILRAQPLLESFAFSELRVILAGTPYNIRSSIQDSDIPNLKSLTARQDMAAAFLPAAHRLESLSLTGWWGFHRQIMRTLEGLPAPRRASIQNLTLSVKRGEEEIWLNLPRILALFPNVQKLNVGIILFQKVPSEAKQLFNQVTEAARVLSRLRQLEVCYEAFNSQFNVDIGLEMEDIIECKTRCPLLETFIDPEGRLWEFEDDAGPGSAREGHGPRLVGRLESRAEGFAEDLPGPERG
ncbi:hypothetical protein FRC04_002037 [Tulasnella sp. 424]|nr:hypothetical protein FRC04_002037 [Tulasnella sp. 424]KAG8968243.1 hypothetical protein FRC05_001624 [Tulasnella sp. 425]